MTTEELRSYLTRTTSLVEKISNKLCSIVSHAAQHPEIAIPDAASVSVLVAHSTTYDVAETLVYISDLITDGNGGKELSLDSAGIKALCALIHRHLELAASLAWGVLTSPNIPGSDDAELGRYVQLLYLTMAEIDDESEEEDDE